MKKISILMMLLIASMAVLVIGCGGSSDDSSGPTKDDYIAQADKICEDGNAEIQAIGTKLGANASKADTLDAVENDLIPAIEARTKTLEALERPSADEAELEAYYQALDDGVSTIADDPKMVFSSQADPFAASDKLAGEYGFKTCGQGA